MKSLLLKLLAAACVAGAVVSAGGWYWKRGSNAAVTFRTAEVKRADVVPTITATGTVEPQEVVDVGAQVAGQILTFGTDDKGKPIDYGSSVSEGMVLARIDDTLFQADVSNAQATLAQAKASVARAVADLGQMKAKLEQAQSDWERAQKLGPSDALSQSDYNLYKANFETAKANVGVGEAAIQQAQATVTQAEAVVLRAQRNLQYTTISSPVKGVIIDRRVNIGQTVVSSLNAPSLFLIAKDLRQIQVWVSVNEADIGNIRPGETVTFGVDAYPGETFHGKVGKIRLNATMTQNVVTYTVEVDTDNSDARLLPYLTANVQFEISHEHNVLVVPNGALRWFPEVEMVSPEVRDAYVNSKSSRKDGAAGGRGGSTSGPAATPATDAGAAQPTTRTAADGITTMPTTRPHRGSAASGAAKRGHATLWVPDGKFVKPIKVRTGVTDGVVTEVISDELTEGTQVVEGVQRPQGSAPGAGAAGGTTNPFAPQFPGRGGGRR